MGRKGKRARVGESEFGLCVIVMAYILQHNEDLIFGPG